MSDDLLARVEAWSKKAHPPATGIWQALLRECAERIRALEHCAKSCKCDNHPNCRECCT